MPDLRNRGSSGALSDAPTLTPSTNSSRATDKECELVFSSVEVCSGSTSSEGGRSSTGNTEAPCAKHEDMRTSKYTTTAECHQALSLEEFQAGGDLEEGEAEYPSGLKLGFIVLAICLSILLMALDNAIITTAIPKITDTFHSLTDVGWYGSSYMLTAASLQLLFGKLYTFLSIKWLYITAIAIFELGSLICGISPNSLTLIMGRAIAGVGCAGIMTGGLSILAHSVPLAKRPVYFGLIGSMYGVASVAGPLLGGVFTDKVTWRWCFFINLPFGALAISIVTFFFTDPVRKEQPKVDIKNETLLQKIRHLDPLGTLALLPSVITLLLALQWGGTSYPWRSPRIITLLTTSATLALIFILLQHLQSEENATLPPRIIRNRTVWASGAYAFCLGGSFFIMCYYVPLWFQAVQGTSAVDSGLRNLPMLISVVVASAAAGASVSALGYYAPFMIAGTVAMAAGAGLVASCFGADGMDTPPAAWIGYQLLFGAGVGLGMQQPLMAVQTVLDLADVPTGTSVINFLQTLGGALFVSAAQAVFAGRLGRAGLLQDPASVVVVSGGGGGNGGGDVQEQVPEVVAAYNEALAGAFLVAAGLAAATVFGSLAVEWRSVRGDGGDGKGNEERGKTTEKEKVVAMP